MKLTSAVDEVKTMSPDELKSFLDGDKKGEFLVIDVRQPVEYEDGHLPGALLMPLDELESRREEIYRDLHIDRKIILYCRSGRRSMAAAIILVNLGLKNLHILDGGLNAWKHKVIKGKPEKKPGVVGKAASISDVLVIAMKLEKAAYEFYISARDAAGFDAPATMFQQLAEVELSHMRRLFLRMTGEIPEKVGISHIEAYLKRFDKEARSIEVEASAAFMKTVEAAKSEEDFLEAAIEREYIANDFYKRAASVVDDEDVRSLLHGLAHDERGHAATLLKQLSQIIRK